MYRSIIPALLLMTISETSDAQGAGNYATVNGLRMYYELHGPSQSAAPPLVLLHGGVGGIATFGPNLPLLAAGRLAIVPGTTHYDLLFSPLVAELVTPFLDAQRD